MAVLGLVVRVHRACLAHRPPLVCLDDELGAAAAADTAGGVCAAQGDIAGLDQAGGQAALLALLYVT